MRTWIQKYAHGWVFLYWIVYLSWFGWLERTVTTDFYVIHSVIDQWIPFNEWFIIPYLLWFPYIAIVIGWFFLHDREEFYRLTVYLYIGMTLFLILCTLFPNGLHLRPMSLPRHNILTDLVELIWSLDTPTNVLPSLHVYNSVVCCAAVTRHRTLSQNKRLCLAVWILTLSIIMSTMMLKQHSVIDVITAVAMAAALYDFVYQPVPRAHVRQLNRSC